jgi:hypothetical protein
VRAAALVRFCTCPSTPDNKEHHMHSRLRRLSRSLSGLVAEDRRDFKRVDASRAPLYDARG